MLFTLALLASAADASAHSKAVADLYRQACVKGELKIDPSKGSIGSIHDLPNHLRGWMRWHNRPIENSTYVRMTDPPETYVMITFYRDVPPGGLVSHCAVASRSIGFEDAADVLFEGEAGRAERVYNNGMWMHTWRIDRPGDGYRKTLRKHRYSIDLETELYLKSEP